MARSFLHIGCGPKRKDQTIPAFQSEDRQELRFDIDESVAPDIIGTMADTSAVERVLWTRCFHRLPRRWLLDRRRTVGKPHMFRLSS